MTIIAAARPPPSRGRRVLTGARKGRLARAAVGQHGLEHPPDVLPAPDAALAPRRRRDIRRGEPLWIGRDQGGVELGPAGRAVSASSCPGDGPG